MSLRPTAHFFIVDSRRNSPVLISDPPEEGAVLNADGELGIGIFAAAAGAAMLTVAIVDSVRASGSTERTEYVTDPPSSTVPCPGPYANATVGIRFRDDTEVGRAAVGKTNALGTLDVDLDVALESSIIPDPNTAITVLVNSTKVGEFDSAPLYKKREERAWSSLNPEACLNPSTVQDCVPFEEFLAKFGDGSYATQAREVLARGKAGMRRIEEEEAWATFDSKLCSTGTLHQSVDEAEAACNAVMNHLIRFPGGVHAAEASETLRKGRARIDLLNARRRRTPIVIPESGGL